MAKKILEELKPGQKGRVTKILGSGLIKQRLLAMGIVIGTKIELERLAPLGNLIEVKIKGYHLSLRKDEAKNIEIEVSK